MGKKKKKEDRKKKRVPVLAAAAIIEPTHRGLPIEAYIINLSYGGMGLYVNEPWLEGRVKIAVSLGVGGKRQVAETVWGRICWKEKMIGTSYVLGVSFEGLNPQDHDRLLAYLDQHTQAP